MATKKTYTKAVTSAVANPDAFKVEESKDTTSQTLAKLATTSALSAVTLKSYSGGGDALEVSDLVTEMKRAGSEAVKGDLGRVERMLVNQLITLDAIFNNMAQRSHRQDTFKGIEVMMRLALKAQAQARLTAEALALMKNPMPFIKQANMTTGPQQVNNCTGTPSQSGIASSAGDFKSEPNKLLEANHEQRLDLGAQATASRADQVMETVGKVHRTSDT